MEINISKKELSKYSGEFLVSGLKTIKMSFKFLRNELDKDDPSYRKQLSQLKKDEENYIEKFLLKYKKKKTKLFFKVFLQILLSNIFNKHECIFNINWKSPTYSKI